MSVACGWYAAAFALDDPDALVAAALSCPLCLGGDSRIDVGLHGGEVAATCACNDCGATWSLALAPQQVLRLALDPPRGTNVHFSEHLPSPMLPLDRSDDDDA
jgi:hypothetical protein